MSYSAQQLFSLIQTAKQSFHRFGVVLDGSSKWQYETLEQLARLTDFKRVLELGGGSLSFATSMSFKQGRGVIGVEFELIVADLNSEFDANGFTAASGTLMGGGLLILLSRRSLNSSFDTWLSEAMRELVHVSEQGMINIPNTSLLSSFEPFEEQKQAIYSIHKVLTGHRKRPLVITADRGRGKSSALGIASAEIIGNSNKKVLVTAPNKSAVSTLFERCADELKQKKTGTQLISESGGKLEYIAPDELLRSLPVCDLLLVDEAAAIPLPLLKQMVEHYHRVCFSTTVHGYEGCGRGFSLKFEPWLDVKRAGWKSLRLTQPIRWNPNDPLEAWLFNTFLLDAEVGIIAEKETEAITFHQLMNCELLSNKRLLSDCFGLLVSAHYQTSPNDLVQLLNDSKVSLYQACQGKRCIAVLLGIKEGGLSEEIVTDVMLGRRRPVGHLAALSLANHLAEPLPAMEKSLRVMRIAVHPDQQGKGVGSSLLDFAIQQQSSDIRYLSTSFGATASLFNFWRQNGFACVRLGIKQDQASGCFSTLFVKELEGKMKWQNGALQQVVAGIIDTAPDYHCNLQEEVLFMLLKQSQSQEISSMQRNLASNYIVGGNGFDCCRFVIRELIVNELSQNDDVLYDKQWELLLAATIKKLSWSALACQFNYSGRKQVEIAIRSAISDKFGRIYSVNHKE